MRQLLALLIAVACVVGLGQPSPALTIANVTVIDGTGAPGRMANVVITNGVIVQVIAVDEALPNGAANIDGRGKFLIPGLWDMHVHLATRPEPELAEKMMLPLLLAHGIVGVRDMGGPLDRMIDLRAKVASGTIAGPRILTPGPFVDGPSTELGAGPGEADPLFRRPADAASAGATVNDLLAHKVDFVKVQSGLAPEVHAALARAAKQAKVTLAGHIPISMTAEEVIAAGQRSIEHISPALIGDGMLLYSCSSKRDELLAELRAIERDRGTAPARAIAEREAALRRRLVESYDPQRSRALGQLMKGRQMWIVPTLVWSATLRPLSGRNDGTDLPMQFVPAALRTRWMARRKDYIGRQTAEGFAAADAVAATAARAVHDLHDGGARVIAGTDAFDAFVLPGPSLHQELQMLVRAGLTPLEALQAATKSAAELRGGGKTEGTIAAGNRADLLLLDDDPARDIVNTRKIRTVVVGGRVYSRDQLDRMLEEVTAFAARLRGGWRPGSTLRYRSDRMRSRDWWTCATVTVLASSSLFGQDTRAEIIARQRAEKAAQLHSYEPKGLEKALLWYENTDPLTKIAPYNGFFVRYGYADKPVGSGIAMGGGWRHDLLDRNARVVIEGGISSRSYRMARADFFLPRLLDERLELGLEGAYRYHPQEDFYGLGLATTSGDRVSFLFKAPEVQGRAVLKPTGWLRSGARVGWTSGSIGPGTDSRFPSVEERFTDATAPGLDEQPDYAYRDLFITLDTRDQPGNARAGAYLGVNWRQYHDLDLNRYSFHRVDFEAQHFLPIFDKKRVLAARFQLMTTTADESNEVPFYLRPTVGGVDTLRSFADFRFRERNAAVLNVEYRWEAFSGLDMALFSDFGTVAPRVSDLEFAELRGAYGIGLRFNTYKEVFLRFDIAGGGSEGIRTFLKFSKAF